MYHGAIVEQSKVPTKKRARDDNSSISHKTLNYVSFNSNLSTVTYSNSMFNNEVYLIDDT